MRDAAQGLKREAVRLVRQDSGLPDALKKLRASRQLEMALASAGDEQARDSLIEQSQRVSSRVLLAIERTASDECIAAVGATELDAGDLVDETLLEDLAQIQMEDGSIADDGLVEELDRWKGWEQLRGLHALHEGRKGELAEELRRIGARDEVEAAEAAE